MLYAIRAEAPFEKISNAAVFKLTGLYLEQIVRKSEQPKTRVAQLAERCRHLRVWRHRRELFGELFLVRITNFDAARIRQHLHYSGADIGERQ